MLQARCEERLAQMDAELTELKKFYRELETPAGRASSASHANDAWVTLYGIQVLELARSHLINHMGELLATARPGTRDSSQAAE